MSIMFNFIASRTQFELIKKEGYISMEKTIQYAKEKNICKKVQTVQECCVSFLKDGLLNSPAVWTSLQNLGDFRFQDTYSLMTIELFIQ